MITLFFFIFHNCFIAYTSTRHVLVLQIYFTNCNLYYRDYLFSLLIFDIKSKIHLLDILVYFPISYSYHHSYCTKCNMNHECIYSHAYITQGVIIPLNSFTLLVFKSSIYLICIPEHFHSIVIIILQNH